MSTPEKIMARLGRNSFDRSSLAESVGGTPMRARAVRADHKRNIAKQFGYPEVITLRMHYDMAYRNSVASNLAFGIVNDSWRVAPKIYDGDEDTERRGDNPTEFEKAIDEHFERLKVWKALKSLDMMQRPMRYGAMVYQTQGEPQGTTATSELKRLPSIDYLVGLRTFHEAQMPIETAVQDPTNLRYGQPVTFSFRTNAPGSTNEWESSGYQISASRVFAIGEGAAMGSFLGIPCNEGCMEDLMDLAKVRGSGAEGLFQNSSNKYAFSLGDGASQADGDAMSAEMEDFDNEISRSMMLGNGSVSMLQTTLFNPKFAWEIALQGACAHHDKPTKLVIGNQSGERASTEDIKSWNRVVMDRQASFCTDIIKDFIRELQEKFTFPRESNYINVVWRDLNESTADQKAELAKKRAETNKTQMDANLPPIYTVDYIQQEAGAPIVDVLDQDEFDIGGEENPSDNLTP